MLKTRFKGDEQEVLITWVPTWMKASDVPGLANVPWHCHRPAHYAPSAEQGGTSNSMLPPLQTDDPPAKRGPGRPRTKPVVPKLVVPKLVPQPPPELVTSEMLDAKRGPGRPPKWLTEARRAAKRGPRRPSKSAHTPVKRKVKQASLASLAVGDMTTKEAAAEQQAALALALGGWEAETEQLHAKRGPGRPPKWLVEARKADDARRAVEAARVLAGLVA